MNKFTAIFSVPEVLRQGKMVANPEAWKKGQITTSFLVGFIGLLVSASSLLGYELPITNDQIAGIAGGIMAVFGVYNSVSTAASTDKVGLKDKPKSE